MWGCFLHKPIKDAVLVVAPMISLSIPLPTFGTSWGLPDDSWVSRATSMRSPAHGSPGKSVNRFTNCDDCWDIAFYDCVRYPVSGSNRPMGADLRTVGYATNQEGYSTWGTRG